MKKILGLLMVVGLMVSVYVSVYYYFLDYMLDNPVVMMVVGLLHLIGAVLLYLKKKSDEERG